VISSGVKIIQQWFTAEQMKDLAEKEKLRTELSLLKSQVNPHFLFNTLNNIYAMAITQSENTADAVMKLAQIMRYILQDAEIELVPLQKDIEFLQHYIELQQFRLSDKVDIAFTITGSPSTLRIAPLLLIPFVENAFKYGVSARQKTRIAMDIRIEGNMVTLWVQNSKPANAAAISKDNTGIGINNTRRRLALLYPDKHDLQIIDQPDQYTVTLKINCA
jgi:sensor histidine kinase YesM